MATPPCFPCRVENGTRIWTVAGQKNVGRRTRIAIWPKSPEYNEDKDIVAALNLVEDRNLDGLRIYHLGLLPWRTVERVMKVLTK